MSNWRIEIRNPVGRLRRFIAAESGMTLYEVMIVLLGTGIITAIAVPVLTTSVNQFNLVSAAQGVMTQLQYARLRAITSNEPLSVNFPSATNGYQVELASGTLLRGPFYLPRGVSFLTGEGDGTGVTFPGKFVTFLTNGSVPTTGNGSTGRVKLVSQSGVRVDIIVSSGGVIRQTPYYRQSQSPF